MTGDPVQATWPAGESFRVQPWKTLLIPADALTDVVSYELREDAKDQHRMFQLQDGQWLEISQKSPEQDQPVEGTPEDTPVAELVNQAEGISFEGSQIEKRMAPGSNEVTVGAELIWRLEEYNGITWVPAEGVSYAVFDENGITSDRIQTTDADGSFCW